MSYAAARVKGKGGGSTPTVVTLNIGSIPSRETIFDISEPLATVGAGVFCSVIGVGAGRDQDELEFDKPGVTGWCITPGSLRLMLAGNDGYVHDTYRVAYTLL